LGQIQHIWSQESTLDVHAFYHLLRPSPRGIPISEQGIYGLTHIFTPLSTYDLVVFYARLIDA
jgi:hypothetical protein